MMIRTVVVLLVLLGLSAAWDCWGACGRKGGWCDACGKHSGRCCRKGWNENGCWGWNGCTFNHCCSLGDCWSRCNRRSGLCSACGPHHACCRKGYNGGGGDGGSACAFGGGGCTGYHCCDKDHCYYADKVDKNWEVYSIHYDVGKAHYRELPPHEVKRETIDNRRGAHVQSTTLTASESYSETKSFSHTAGVSVTVGTEFSVGTPIIAEGKVSVEVSASYEFSYGHEKTTTKTQTRSYSCTASPGKYVICKAMFSRFAADVPYTAKWRMKKDHRCTKVVNGIFKEVSGSAMHLEVTENNGRMELVKRTIIH